MKEVKEGEVVRLEKKAGLKVVKVVKEGPSW